MPSKFVPSIFTNDASCLPLKEKIQDYLNYYSTGSYNTSRARVNDLNHFVDYIEGKHVAPLLGDITFADVVGFRDYRLITEEESPATVARRLATVKHFFRMMGRWYPGFLDPARDVKAPHIENQMPRGMSAEHERAIRELAHKQKEAGYIQHRNCVLVEILLETGLRVAEVRSLSLKQIDLEGRRFVGVTTKSNKKLEKPFSDHLAKVISDFLPIREEYFKSSLKRFGMHLPTDKANYPLLISVWCFRDNDPISFRMNSKSIWRAVSDMAIDAKVPHYSPHQYRHTFAHGLLDSSKDIMLVAQALGHKDVKVTMRYLLSKEDRIRKALNDRHKKAA